MSIAKTFKAIMFGVVVVSPVSGVKFRRETISACSGGDPTKLSESRSVVVSESSKSDQYSTVGDGKYVWFGLVYGCVALAIAIQKAMQTPEMDEPESNVKANCDCIKRRRFELVRWAKVVCGCFEAIFSCAAMVSSWGLSRSAEYDALAHEHNAILVGVSAAIGVCVHKDFGIPCFSPTICTLKSDLPDLCLFPFSMIEGGYSGFLAGEWYYHMAGFVKEVQSPVPAPIVSTVSKKTSTHNS